VSNGSAILASLNAMRPTIDSGRVLARERGPVEP
jgi:hypothetical protein